LREFQIARKETVETDQNNGLTQFTDAVLRKAGCSVDLTVPVNADIDSSAILTQRELQILESLSLGLSNRAIAGNLFVAETTVRSHLRKINVKLGVGNRTQAVNISRRLGLIK
jgi:LuxR family maltose regulon positive regulatory protein